MAKLCERIARQLIEQHNLDYQKVWQGNPDTPWDVVHVKVKRLSPATLGRLVWSKPDIDMREIRGAEWPDYQTSSRLLLREIAEVVLVAAILELIPYPEQKSETMAVAQ